MEQDGAQDWFDMHVTRACDGQDTFIGGIRFPQKSSGTPASIANNGGTWIEAAGFESNTINIPYTHVTLSAAGGNGSSPAVHATGAYDDQVFPSTYRLNCDIEYDSASKLVHMRLGQHRARCHPGGHLF
jgi:hypothetical protein